MPVVRDIPLSLKLNEVLRREGFRGYATVRAEIKSQITELLDSIKSARLLEPAMTYEIHPVTGMSPGQVSLEDDKAVQGSLLPSIFPEAKELVAIVVTIGPRLEKQVTDYSKGGETMRAMLLDGIGSSAVDMLNQEACRFIAGQASSREYQASSPVNPGMPGLPITEQWNLLELAKANEIGVSLTSSGIMVPRKSTSMVIALGPQMRTWTQAEICACCNLRETCPYCVLRD
jgi:hypothetical protein